MFREGCPLLHLGRSRLELARTALSAVARSRPYFFLAVNFFQPAAALGE